MGKMYYIGLDVHKKKNQVSPEGREWRDSRGRHDSPLPDQYGVRVS
jgi:hypothetical protein